MKNIFLIAKHTALINNSDIITRDNIQIALNNVTILDEDISSFIYNAFDMDFSLPQASYTKDMLQNIRFKSAIKVENYLKNIFNNIKSKKNRIDIMNISILNNIFDLEDKYLEYIGKNCKNLRKYHKEAFKLLDCDYIYETKEAAQELGLEEELIEELIEDYIAQVFKTNIEFTNLISSMWEKNFLNTEYSLEPLMNLIHKSLGVAKNLRIKDAVFILSAIQEQNDLEIISIYLDTLVNCTIKLRPKQAIYNINYLNIKPHSLKNLYTRKKGNNFKIVRNSLS